MDDFRVYTVQFSASAQTNAVDWFEVATTAAGKIGIVGIEIGQTTELGDSAEEQIDWYIKRGSGSYTSGSGGNTGVTPQRMDPGDATATFTAETLNTTKIAVGTGTLVTLHNGTFNVRSGLQAWWPPRAMPRCGASSALAVGMTGNPADSVTWVGTLYVAEYAP